MKMPRDLLPRVAVAVVGIPLVVWALHLGGWFLGGLMGGAVALGAWEFYAMMRLRGDRPFALLGSLAAGGMVLLGGVYPTFGAFAPAAALLLLGVAGASMALSLFFRWPGGSPSAALNATVSGVAYVGLPMAFLPLLRSAGDRIPGVEAMGLWIPMGFVLLPLLVTWAGDAAAYFVGTAIGRVKLAPAVSPGKSVEGSVAGLVGSVAASVLICGAWLSSLPVNPVSTGFAVAIGAALAVVTQLGDLVESLLKREAGVKDSGNLLPGHGGFLDRLDALLWAYPTTWILLTLSGTLP